ncbi:hypothetical protein [Variovorax rhizosphaerae]|uniref:Uncharacterized protein n=1 Tax=Variovorax rhizosphaerae TaxID=1836200 RepID=A0ABU8WN59_9BURK
MLEVTGPCEGAVRARLKGAQWVSVVRYAARVSEPNALMAVEGMHDLVSLSFSM